MTGENRENVLLAQTKKKIYNSHNAPCLLRPHLVCQSHLNCAPISQLFPMKWTAKNVGHLK